MGREAEDDQPVFTVTVTRRVVLCMSPPSSGDLLPRLRYKRTGHRRRTPEEGVPGEEMIMVEAVTAE